jgi:uncharacterized membrane protein YfcA
MEWFGGDASLFTLFFVVVGGFLAGFIDSIAGGGGLISLPVLLTAGLPPHYALGTNKFASTFGILMSSYQFYKARKVDMKLVKKLLPFTFMGACFGAVLMVNMSADMLKPIIICALIGTAAFVMSKRDWGNISTYHGETKKKVLLWCLTAFVIGLYDGFIGPGTGTFLIVGFVMTGFDFVLAAGNAKMLNMMSNVTAFVLFVYWNKVLYGYGILMAASLFCGAYFGSRLAITKGSSFIRAVMLVVTALLIGKLTLDYLGIFK